MGYTPKTVSFLFAPYCFAAQQATAEGRRNNVSLHFVSLPLVALGTNPCLRQLRVAPTSRQRKRRENNSPFFSLSSSRSTLHRLRQRDNEIMWRDCCTIPIPSQQSCSLRIPASAKRYPTEPVKRFGWVLFYTFNLILTQYSVGFDLKTWVSTI